MGVTSLLNGSYFVHLSNIGLFAQALHTLHVVFNGHEVCDLCGTGSRKPASHSIAHPLPIAPC